MSDVWQWAIVVAIEALAIAFLVYKLRPRRGSKKPDVRASDLVRKNRKD
jgi:hypothetical protein